MRGADDDEGGHGAQRWWRLPLAVALVAVPVLAGAAGLRLGCEAGVFNSGLCGDLDAPISAAAADLEIAGGITTVAVTDEAGAPIATIREPAPLFPGQFLKFVVAAPDNSRVLYVTATSLGMDDASFWMLPRGGSKQMLKSLGDTFWVARPAWCQARPGDPGRIAYILKAPVTPTTSGLELWVITADGAGDRRVLEGTAANGLVPELFYGDRPSPLRFMQGCARLRYGDDAGLHVVDLDGGVVRTAVNLPGAPAATPTPVAGAGAPAGQPCYLKPFAQTDPRWGENVMRTENTAIRSWGCALTSTAMVFNYYGVEIDPGRLNQCAANQADLLYWEPVRQRCGGDPVTATHWSGQASWADLGSAVAAGRPAIVGLQGGPAGSHF
jgi:hypothetical protein